MAMPAAASSAAAARRPSPRAVHEARRRFVAALDHEEPRDTAVVLLGDRADAAGTDDVHQPGALEYVQVVADVPLGMPSSSPSSLVEAARSRRSPTIRPGYLVAEGSQLGGIGDDERVGGVVVGR